MSAAFDYNELHHFPQDILILLLSFFSRTPLVDDWAERIATWNASLPLGQLISQLDQYVPCGMYDQNAKVADNPVKVYAIWVATESIPLSVYQSLARTRTPLFGAFGAPPTWVVREILFTDWMEVHTNHSRVQHSRAQRQAAEVQQDGTATQTTNVQDETVGL